MLLEDFPWPSLSLLSKIGKGKIDAIKYAQVLKKDGKISVSYLMKCIYKNVRSSLEVNWLVQTRMENYIKELYVLW